ncbi:hypothetical protein ACCH70_004212 [Vibrio vulnificus]|nr:hypothetical protein [Vibrio vulnificus]ELX4172071.1 hypothetical protein [Vibrio vulnificus]HAS8420121.1 hypothetical protein [Vibrio vulnificus]
MVDHYELGNDPACDEYLASTPEQEIIDGLTNAIEPEDYDEFLKSVHHALRRSIEIIESSANRYYPFGEEELNSLVAGLLVGQSFDASPEKNCRGNIDISVKNGDFKWNIEAKIGKTNNYIFEGLLQILTRYSTSEKDFGLLVYFKNKQPSIRFNEWCQYIDTAAWEDYSTKNGILEQLRECIPPGTTDSLYTTEPINNGMFAKRNMITSQGCPINIQFVGVNLYYNPLDKSGRNGVGQKLFHAKESIQVEYLNHKHGNQVDLVKLMDSVGVLIENSADFKL